VVLPPKLESRATDSASLKWTSAILRTATIHGGTNEVQFNIIAKRVLGLPD